MSTAEYLHTYKGDNKALKYFAEHPLKEWSFDQFKRHFQKASLRTLLSSYTDCLRSIENTKKVPPEVLTIVCALKKEAANPSSSSPPNVSCNSNYIEGSIYVNSSKTVQLFDSGDNANDGSKKHQREEEEDEHRSAKKGKKRSTDRDKNPLVERLLGELNNKKISVMKDIVTNQKPSSMSQQLNVMAAQMALDFDPKNSEHTHALKLHLSTPALSPSPSPSPAEFRKAVYAYGVKALGNKFLVEDNFELQRLVNLFVPATLGEQLDIMSAKLIMSVDLKNATQVNALKLSLSRIVDFVNGKTASIFQQYLGNTFWEQVKSINITLCPGMPNTAIKLYEAMISEGSIDGKLIKTQLRLAIAKKKLSLLESGDSCSLQILDIMDLLARCCLPDSTNKSDSPESELTVYRKFAKVLDEILDGTMLNMLDGESTCKASKSIAKVHEKMYGSTIPRNSGFGRRIDLILSSKNLELSASEWKRANTVSSKCLQQQCKNIRMNKAILTNLMQLPLDKSDCDAAFIVGLDWVGNLGYMFAGKQVQDIYVSKRLSVLSMPVYFSEIPLFKNTLNCLYAWRNHHLVLKDIMLPALRKYEQDMVFSSLLGQSFEPKHAGISPNLYLTPSQRRKKEATTNTSHDSSNLEDLEDLEDMEEYDEDGE